MESGLKVYYLPLLNMAAGVVHVGFFSWLHLFREVWVAGNAFEQLDYDPRED